MAQLPQAFDASKVDPAAAREPVPEGWYTAMITESEMKQTKNRAGYYLELTLQILDGPYKGRMLWDRLNLVNQNDTAKQIAERTLSAICHATGRIAIRDSVELHNIPLQVKATYRAATEQYRATNEIDGYRKADGTQPAAKAAPAPQAAPAPTQQSQPAPAASAPPWARTA